MGDAILQEGDRVVVQGTQKVQPGMAVNPVAVDQPSPAAEAPAAGDATPAAATGDNAKDAAPESDSNAGGATESPAPEAPVTKPGDAQPDGATAGGKAQD